MSVLSAPWIASRSFAKSSPNEQFVAAVAGVRGRGNNLLETFASLPEVHVKYICDVDATVLQQRTEQTAQTTGRRPESIKDFRRALDDDQVDVLVLGTPDHWHALPTIMACQAGKDVYVEKPDGHNLLEGRTMVEAARKHGRIVQLGTQSRSAKHLVTAMEYVRQGNLGKVHFAKAWENTKQGSIGHPPDSDPPEGVDYDLWLGPAPKRPFNVRRFHSSWRWFFDYGTGDLGNDGVHRLDYARWALETAIQAQGGEPLGWPRRVSASGGKFYFDDDQEWPDTLQVTFEYPNSVLTYEMRVWAPYFYQDEPEGAAVYGDAGYIIIANKRWRAFDSKGEKVAEDTGEPDTLAHAKNFLDCVRSRQKPAADHETIGYVSSALCHLGNAAWRTGRSLRFDPERLAFIDDEEANRYLTRPEYRAPWLLPKLEDI
ncbi:MAG TPA: Gfo/Idh/MocA family oxidoreductase [bacterium]|nr:Gfo/Idh/MocA family oxidoreductase [bacterium]